MFRRFPVDVIVQELNFKRGPGGSPVSGNAHEDSAVATGGEFVLHPQDEVAELVVVANPVVRPFAGTGERPVFDAEAELVAGDFVAAVGIAGPPVQGLSVEQEDESILLFFFGEGVRLGVGDGNDEAQRQGRYANMS